MTATEHAPTPERSTGRRRAVRVLGWTGTVLGLVLLVVVLLVAGVLAYLRTESGLAQLATMIEKVASGERSKLAIGSLEGAFPEHLRLENVSLTDDQGVLLTIDFADLRWHPWRLLSRHLAVSVFEIGTIDVHRLSAAEPAPAQEAGPMELPSLPMDVTLDSFRMRELRLAQAILGQAARLTASASLSATRQGEFGVNADVHTLGGVPTRLSLAAGYDASTAHLKVDVEADEAGGGLVGGLLGLPGSPPLRLVAKGDGPLRDWRGNLTATAGSLAAIEADVGLSGERPLRVALDGSADIQGLLPPDLAPLTAGGLAVAATGDVFSERITLNSLGVTTAAGSLRGEGTFMPKEKRLDGKMALTLGPATVWEPLLPGIG